MAPLYSDRTGIATIKNFENFLKKRLAFFANLCYDTQAFVKTHEMSFDRWEVQRNGEV
jgi:hypothetical protein